VAGISIPNPIQILLTHDSSAHSKKCPPLVPFHLPLFRCQTCVAFETIFGGFEASEGSEWWVFWGLQCVQVTRGYPVPPPPLKEKVVL